VSEALAGLSFGELLAEFRRAAGLTRAALARRAELNPRSIRYLESGGHETYSDTIHRLATALDLSDADRVLLEGAGRPATNPSQPSPRLEPSNGPTREAPDVEAAPAHNLPAQLTSFIGREREQAELHQLLMSARLVTLTGPGGIGKTRLALEVATTRLASTRTASG
jgi:transcriptional regulator with XRE-family HTH domain